METWGYILEGFSAALTLQNLMFVLIGVTLGTIIGLLPGLGSATGVAILIPLTVGLEPLTALIMLAGLYYGSQYGGSITAVLVATPGEPSQVMTVLDGYALARKGRAGAALAIAAISSFVAGVLTIPLVMILTPILAVFALRFGPPETFALLVFGLISIGGLTGQHMAKGIAMGALGVALSTVGLDPQTGIARFTFGNSNLLNGIGFVPVVIGVFAIGEVLSQVSVGGAEPIRTRFREMWPSRAELRHSRWPMLRGTGLGFVLGVLPGAGATVAAFFGYDLERRLSKRKQLFGKGAIEGVASPEAANNAAVNGSFVPTLTLGIPGSATTAVLLGAFLLYGLRPGPLLLSEQPQLVYGLLASFLIGNITLLLLNLPLAPVFALLLRLRYSLMYPVILLVSLLGAYAVQNSVWAMWVAAFFGVVGYLMKRYDYPTAPLVLGLILGGMMETALLQTSSMGQGSLAILFTRPIAAALFAMSAVLIVAPSVWRQVRRARSGKAVPRPADDSMRLPQP